MCGGKNSREVGQALKPGRQPEDKKPSVKGTPPMETPKVPDLTMIHADLLHYQPTQGCGNFVYKILCWGIRYPSRTNTVFIKFASGDASSWHMS
jgi:hypothetical protein